MLTNKNRAALFALTILTSTTLSAYANRPDHLVIASHCLLDNTSVPFQKLASSKKLRLIKTDAAGISQLINAKTKLQSKCGGFMDVTQAWEDNTASSPRPKQRAKYFLADYEQPRSATHLSDEPYKVRFDTTVNTLLTQINPQEIWSNLTTLTHFDDRYAGSDNGVKAAEWIKTQVETMAKEAGRNDVHAYYVATGSRYKQPSIVVKVGDSDEAGVVIGGHMDTLASSWEKKPGADDDGSGSVTVLETARVILNSGLHFKKPIYFVWYSAEEMGLVGSQHVVADFKQKNIPVDAVVQFDMTGYRYHNDPTIWMMDDYVNTALSTFTETLINTYVKQPVKHSRCGYACSDHASWTHGGFKSSMPFEANMNSMNPYIHTANDTMDRISLEHMTSFAKLGVAFAVELAEPSRD